MTLSLECGGVTVAYNHEEVLRSVSLEVSPEEVVAVLGPSGSGKTTLLYAVAGFVDLAAGEISIGGRPVATPHHQDPPEMRSVGFVFQHYALWPHLDALATVAFPLRRRGLDSGAATGQARDLLERMDIADLAHRKPAELSGGEQQRVGLARALAGRPGLYLFDEPTAHLDTALRVTLQEELADQRRASGAAAVYATHDSGEALAIADRIALLRDGAIVQIGSPEEVYTRPVDFWAARLTGPASVLYVDIAQAGQTEVVVRYEGRTAKVEGAAATPGWASVLVRPDWAELGGDLPGRVTHVWYRGPYTDYRLETAAGLVEIRRGGTPVAKPGERVNWMLRRIWSVPDVVPQIDHG
jgi:ABC-type Fe3+/spermidine/putrescine transport system ATPase subunit